MAAIRSVVQCLKAVAYFGVGTVELLIKRPRTPQARADWLHGFCGRLLRGMGVQLTVEGSFPRRGALISNHQGYLDILVYAALAPVVYCAKAEMERWPLLGWMTTMAGSVYVDRGAGGSAERAKAGMRAAAAAGIPVVFFPEGTTSNGQQVLPFRSGLLAQAIDAGEAVTAARAFYTLEEHPGNGDARVEDQVNFWSDDAEMLKHIFRFVGLRGVHVRVRIAPEPIHFSSSAALDRKQAAIEAREAVVRLEDGQTKYEEDALVGAPAF